LSYRRSWTKLFDPAEFDIDVPPMSKSPEICPDHENCFKAEQGTWDLRVSGTWHLKVPIDVKSVMPGTRQKILQLTALGMREGWLGWAGWVFACEARFVRDGAESPPFRINCNSDDWRENKFKDLNIDLSTTRELDFRLWQDVAFGFPSTGPLAMHAANIKVDCEYYSDIPPETATVRLTVIDSKSGKLVSDAYVALMSGARVVADGYTDGGEVIFENVEEGSYTVKVLAGGYYNFEMAVDVEPPSVWYELRIVPIPTPPIPDWVKYAVIGTGVLIGAVAVLKRKKPEVVVVK